MRLLIAFCVLFQALVVQSQPVINLESRVTGNQEQPNVLSIVPWKEARDRRRIDQGIERDINNLFQHLDAEELERQFYFHQTFSEQAQEESIASQQVKTP